MFLFLKGKPTDALLEGGALVRTQQYGEQVALDHVPGAECVTMAQTGSDPSLSGSLVRAFARIL